MKSLSYAISISLMSDNLILALKSLLKLVVVVLLKLEIPESFPAGISL